MPDPFRFVSRGRWHIASSISEAWRLQIMTDTVKPARKALTKAVMAATLAATVFGGLAATPAQADPWRGGYRHHGGSDAGVAIGAGILGLAVGAAIASSDRPHYYRERVYYRRPVVYDYPAPAYYYGDPYYRSYYRPTYREEWRSHHRPAYYPRGYYGGGHYEGGWRHR